MFSAEAWPPGTWEQSDVLFFSPSSGQAQPSHWQQEGTGTAGVLGSSGQTRVPEGCAEPRFLSLEMRA